MLNIDANGAAKLEEAQEWFRWFVLNVCWALEYVGGNCRRTEGRYSAHILVIVIMWSKSSNPGHIGRQILMDWNEF